MEKDVPREENSMQGSAGAQLGRMTALRIRDALAGLNGMVLLVFVSACALRGTLGASE